MRVSFGTLSLRDLAMAVQAALVRVPRTEFVDVTANATADTPFIVPHTLGVKPRSASAMSVADGYLYVSADDLAEWTSSQIKVRHTVAGARLVVRVDAT